MKTTTTITIDVENREWAERQGNVSGFINGLLTKYRLESQPKIINLTPETAIESWESLVIQQKVKQIEMLNAEKEAEIIMWKVNKIKEYNDALNAKDEEKAAQIKIELLEKEGKISIEKKKELLNDPELLKERQAATSDLS